MNHLKATTSDVRMYSDSFENAVLEAVCQWLEVFESHDELLQLIRIEIKDRRDYEKAGERRANIERAKFREEKVKEHNRKEHMADEEGGDYPGEPPTLPVIGFCPKCDSLMGGTHIQGCEMKKSGRFFYKECSACSYHVEIFKKRNKYIETEGG